MYKAVNKLAPAYLCETINLVKYEGLQLRSQTNETLQCVRPKTEMLKKAFSFRGVHLWNKIPLCIRNSTSMNEFKK